MPTRDRENVITVAPTYGAGDRDAAGKSEIGDEQVAPGQACVGEREATEAIAGEGIDAALIEDQIGREASDQWRERAIERLTIFIIVGAVGQRHIKRRARLASGKVLFGMD